MFDEIKGILGGTGESKPNASGQWIDGKFVPNEPQEQEYQQAPQQVPQQYAQPQQVPQQYAQPQQVPQQGPQQVPQQYTQQYAQPQQYQQPVYQQPVYQQPVYQQPQPKGGLKCPKCKGNNISVQLIEVGAKTKTHKTSIGLGGHMHNAMRGVAAVGTLGMSNLVIKKATGEEKGRTKTKNQKFCICQNCGHSWKV